MEPFVDKHREELIRKVTNVDPILDDLKELLKKENYEYLKSRQTSKEKMEALFGYVSGWNESYKDRLYELLKKHDEEIIRDLEKQDRYASDKARERLLQREYEMPSMGSAQSRARQSGKLKPVLKGSRKSRLESMLERKSMRKSMMKRLRPDPITPEAGPSHKVTSSKALKGKTSGDASTSSSNESSQASSSIFSAQPKREKQVVSFQHRECRLCGKAPNYATLVAPEKIENKYRLQITTSGTVRCSETGLAFVVRDAVTIEYNLESWSNLGEFQLSDYDIIGPLFNINADDSTRVEEIHLPHYLCLKALNGEVSQVKCAHFSHGNLTLQTPDRIEPFYVVVNNPTFSLLGILYQLFEKIKIPVHGIVFIYFKMVYVEDPEYKEYKIHLYFVADSLQTEKVLDKRKTHFGFWRLEKPPQTIQTVYGKTEYYVHANLDASVVPEMLQLHTNCQSDNIPFTEIIFTGNVEDIQLCIFQQDNSTLVWHTKITKGDVHEIMRGKRKLSSQNTQKIKAAEVIKYHQKKYLFGYNVARPHNCDHFVIRHRQALIERVPIVEPILEELKSHNILSDEDYNTVRGEQTSQMKMRKLFDFVRSWGTREKDVFYEALRKKNGPLVTDLEQTSSSDTDD